MKMKDILSPARGKINLKCDLYSHKTKTLKLKCGPGTGYLALDVDEPGSPNAWKLLKFLNRNDFIVYSDKYTLDDVFSGICRYKVIFKYKGNHIPNKRKNRDIEVFYSNSNKPVCIWGRKNDYENYIYSGNVRDIHFDINDIMNEKVPFDLFNEKIVKNKKKTKKKESDEDNENNLILENNITNISEADINELRVIFKHLAIEDIKMEYNKNFITFNCLFPELHSKKNYAYAFKIDNNYVVRCQGKVCYEQYAELNKNITKYILSKVKFDNFETFKDIKENKVNLFVAPTGWGKTERIAGEILKTINNNERLLVLMPDKVAMARLLDRVDEYSNNHLNVLLDTNKIITYTSETKQRLVHNNDLIINANVIISHHYYFWNAGELLTYYPTSWEILELDNLNLIIDEAHTFIERGTRLDLKIGAMYEKSYFNNDEVFRLNRKKLTRDEVFQRGDKQISNCLHVEKDKFQSFKFDLSYRVYENKGIEYIDIYKILKERLNKVKEWEENQGQMRYSLWDNNEITNIKKNEIKNTKEYNTIIQDLLLGPTENALLSMNQGDDIARVKIGEMILTLFHYQIIKKVLNTPKQVILTTATIKPYHYDILEKVLRNGYVESEIKTKIEKIKQIRLLWSEEKVNIKNNILEVLDNYNMKSLVFIQTINKAKNLLKTYNHILLNDNGNYMFGKRKNESDYGDNIERNITVAGLESSVAKGYNYIEEIEGKNGFEVLYFDGEPISPTRIKKYINNGEVKDHSSNYNMASLAQAIGRVFRKEKDVLTICLRGFKKETYNDILEYLKTTTTSNIIEGKLNITNFKIAISKLEKNTDSLLSGNSFYDKIKEVE